VRCGIQCHCSHVQEDVSWRDVPAAILAYTSAEGSMSTMFVLIGVGSPSSGPKYRFSTDPKLAPAECQQKSKAKGIKDFLERENFWYEKHSALCVIAIPLCCNYSLSTTVVAGSSLSDLEKCWQEKTADTTLGGQTGS